MAESKKEYSVAEIYAFVRDMCKYLLSKWYLLLLFGLIFGLLGIFYAWKQKPQYLAEITFVIEDNTSSPAGMYGALASQFGIDLGGAGGNTIFKGENIIEFLKSRLMIERALLSKRSDNESFADFYIKFKDYKKSWAGKPHLKTIHYPPHYEVGKNRVSDSILLTIEDEISNDIVSVDREAKKAFFTLRCKSENELFSKELANLLLDKAADYYITTKTQNAKNTVDNLQRRADSILYLLNRKTFTAASTQDLNVNPSRRVVAVSTELATRDKIVLQTIYGEITKNLELAKVNLSQLTPVIQLIDTPLLPLEKKKPGRLKTGVLAAIAGGLIGLILLSANFMVQNFRRKVRMNFTDVVSSPKH